MSDDTGLWGNPALFDLLQSAPEGTEQRLSHQVRIHYSFGVNSGTSSSIFDPDDPEGLDAAVESIVNQVSQKTYGRIDVDLVEVRSVLEVTTPWVTAPGKDRS